jgi:hypothetical protein
MSPSPPVPLTSLFASLRARRRPEDVAEIIRDVLGDALTNGEARCRARAAEGSLKRSVWHYTSMLEEFAGPVGCGRQIAKARELFETAYPMAEDHCRNPQAIERFVFTVSAEIGKAYGRSDFKAHRLKRAARETAGLGMGHRAYNKRFRLLGRLEGKFLALARETKEGRAPDGYQVRAGLEAELGGVLG